MFMLVVVSSVMIRRARLRGPSPPHRLTFLSIHLFCRACIRHASPRKLTESDFARQVALITQ